MSNTIESKRSAVVIYDGECRFCIAQVDGMKKLDTQHQLEFIPRQAQESEQRFPQIKGIPLDDGILLIGSDSSVHVAADAIFEIFERLPARRKLARLYHVPVLKQIIQIGYRLVAANRRRLGQTCSNDGCKLPVADKPAGKTLNTIEKNEQSK